METKGFCTEGTKNMLCVSPRFSYYRLQTRLGFFVLLLNASLANAIFIKFFFCLSLQETEPIWDFSFGPSSLSTKHAQAIFSKLISSRIPCGFAMAKPLCFIPKVERAGQLFCVLQPCPNGTQCWVPELCESSGYENGQNCGW